MALKMRPLRETVEQVARTARQTGGGDAGHPRQHGGKGQIGSFKMFGQQMYALFPFLPGIYEFQSERMDKELAGTG